ncbi:MAG: hypothetical protein WCP19_08790 [Chloroflexota bacterium]
MLKSTFTIFGRILIILLASAVIFSFAYAVSLANPSTGRFRPEGDHQVSSAGSTINNNTDSNNQPNFRSREGHEGSREGVSITRGLGQLFTNSLITAIFVWLGLLIFPRFRRRMPTNPSPEVETN